MKHLFVSYETALKLKELGFDEECLAWYNNKNIERYTAPNFRGIKNFPFRLCPTAPLYQQVIDWLREKHRIVVRIDFHAGSVMSFDPLEKYFQFIVIKAYNNSTKNALDRKYDGISFNSYYEGLNFAIEEALKLIKNGKLIC